MNDESNADLSFMGIKDNPVSRHKAEFDVSVIIIF